MDLRNLCYPYIHDDNWITDYEVLTDGYSSQIGFAYSQSLNSDIKNDLKVICELTLHLNPLVRKYDLSKIINIYNELNYLYEKYNVKFESFYLPIGSIESTSISILREKGKQIIRLLVKNKFECKELLNCFNLLVNLFHLMYLNVQEEKVVFKSRSY